ncbi:hypothetical protein STEG23_016241 [Scotinomys teguina]
MARKAGQREKEKVARARLQEEEKPAGHEDVELLSTLEKDDVSLLIIDVERCQKKITAFLSSLQSRMQCVGDLVYDCLDFYWAGIHKRIPLSIQKISCLDIGIKLTMILKFGITGPNSSDREIEWLVHAYETSKIMCTVYERLLYMLTVGLVKAASFTWDRKHSPYPWLSSKIGIILTLQFCYKESLRPRRLVSETSQMLQTAYTVSDSPLGPSPGDLDIPTTSISSRDLYSHEIHQAQVSDGFKTKHEYVDPAALFPLLVKVGEMLDPSGFLTGTETRKRFAINTHQLEATTVPINGQTIGTQQSVQSKDC